VVGQDPTVGIGAHARPNVFAALAAGERWYVVHALPHGEDRARSRLAAEGFRCFLPRYLKTVRHARKLGRRRPPGPIRKRMAVAKRSRNSIRRTT
jgi:hypothetical protein